VHRNFHSLLQDGHFCEVVSPHNSPLIARTLSQFLIRAAKKLLLVVEIVYIPVVIFLLGLNLAKNGSLILHLLHLLTAGDFLLATVTAIASALCFYGAWRTIFNGRFAKLSQGQSFEIYFLGNLGKYIPGAILPTVIHTQIGGRSNRIAREFFFAQILFISQMCFVGPAMWLALLPLNHDELHRTPWWMITLAVGAVIGFSYPVFDRLAGLGFRIIGKPIETPRLSLRTWSLAVAFLALNFVMIGTSLAGLVAPWLTLSMSHTLLCISILAIAIPVGVVAIFSPAGLGVREFIVVYFLASSVPQRQAIAVSIVQRTLLILIDLGLAAVALLVGNHNIVKRLRLRRGAPQERISASGESTNAA